MKKRSPLGLAALALTVAAPFTASAQDSDAPSDELRFRAEQLLPANTVFFVSTPDVTQMRKAWGATSLASVLGMRSFRKLCHDLLKAERRERKRQAPDEGLVPSMFELLNRAQVTPATLAGAISGQVVVALFPVEKEFRWAFLAEVPEENRARATHLIGSYFGEKEKHAPVAVFLGESDGIQFNEHQMAEGSIVTGYVGNFLVITQGPDAFESVIQRSQVRNLGSLSSRKPFADLRAKLGRDSHFQLVVVDLAKFRSSTVGAGLIRAMKPSVERYVSGLLLPARQLWARPGMLGIALKFEGKAIRDRVVYQPSKGTLLPFLVTQPLQGERASAKFIARDALDYIVFRGKLTTWLKQLREAKQNNALPLSKLSNSLRWLIENIDNVAERWGDLEGEFGLARVRVSRKETEWVFVLNFSDTDTNTAGDSVRLFLLMLNGSYPQRPLKKESKGVFMMHFPDFAGVEPSEEEKAKITPLDIRAVAIKTDTDDVVLLSSSKNAVEMAARHFRRPGGGIAATKDYRDTSGKFAADAGRHLIWYENMRSKLEEGYSRMLPGMQGIAQENHFVVRLATEKILSEHFSMGLFTQATFGRELAVDSYGSIGHFLQSVGDIVLQRLQLDPDSRTDQTQAGEPNLTRLGVALHLYASDYDTFPQNLSQLYPTYTVPAKNLQLFVKSGNSKKLGAAREIDSQTDYVYLAGRSLKGLSDDALAFDRKPVKKHGGRFVLYLDGSVKYLKDDEFNRQARRGDWPVPEQDAEPEDADPVDLLGLVFYLLLPAPR